MSFRIYKPEIFQGSLTKKKYFEGWYFKHVSNDMKHVWSFIPGISLNEKDPHCFIQIINGITGTSDYISYPPDSFSWDKNSVYLKIDGSVFTDKYIDLKIGKDNINIEGHIDFINSVKYPKTLFSPGIMGWYSFVPYMECKHGIVSVDHELRGSINLNGESVEFSGGKGYIEKDWGTSFPEAWIWIQSNNFSEKATAFTFSVAKIPWRGKFFIGFISFLYYKKKFHVYATYHNSVISHISYSENTLNLVLKNRNTSLEIEVLKSSFGELRAPVSGDMSRRIKESIDSEVKLNLYDNKGKLIYNDIGKRAGLEVIDKIFEYL
jgi:tocopherol cyclase